MTNFCGIVRDILIISDSRKYFEEAWKKHWFASFDPKTKEEILYHKFGVDFSKLVKKYGLYK